MGAAEALIVEGREIRSFFSSLVERSRKAGTMKLEELVGAYRTLNPIANDARKSRDSLRNELVERVAAVAKKDEDGRLTIERAEGPFSQDAKGNLHIKLEDGDHLELRPRSKDVLSEEKAEEVLGELDLLQDVLEHTTTVTDIDRLKRALSLAADALRGSGQSTMADFLEGELQNSTKTTSRISEDRIADLVKEGKLEMEALASMFDTRTTYALYDVSAD